MNGLAGHYALMTPTIPPSIFSFIHMTPPDRHSLHLYDTIDVPLINLELCQPHISVLPLYGTYSL